MTPVLPVWNEQARSEIFELGRQKGLAQAFDKIESVLAELGDEKLAAVTMAALRSEQLS